MVESQVAVQADVSAKTKAEDQVAMVQTESIANVRVALRKPESEVPTVVLPLLRVSRSVWLRVLPVLPVRVHG